MNTPEPTPTISVAEERISRELRSLKYELLQAESRLEKARKEMTSAEIDIRALRYRIAATANPPKPTVIKEWDQRYRRLEKGETIEPGDEIDASPDGWRDAPKWETVGHKAGGTAPDPSYPAHRQYRRLIGPTPPCRLCEGTGYTEGLGGAGVVRCMCRDNALELREDADLADLGRPMKYQLKQNNGDEK